MKMLVTGATGFMGARLCTRLQEAGHEVVGLGSHQADLTRQGSLAAWESKRFDQIWHLATWTQAGDFCLTHQGEQWIRNQQINTNVLTWWAEKQPQAKLVTIGTSCAYAPSADLSEEHYLDGEPIESLYTYGMVKRILLVGLRALRKQYGLNHLYLIPSTLYGPGYHTDGRQMHFIFDLVRKILAGKMYGEPVVLWGDGHQCRELVHLDDFISAAMRLAAQVNNEVVNVGAGAEYTIRHFANLIAEKVGYDASEIKYDTTRYVGARSKCLSTHKLEKLLPDFRQRTLDEGLDELVAWFLERRDELVQPANGAQHAAA